MNLDQRKQLAERLGPDLLTLINIADLSLDSWAIRMMLERKSKLSEERLESLGDRLRTIIKEVNPLGTKEEVIDEL